MSDIKHCYKSLAFWPKGVCRNQYGNNVSEDTHSSLIHANSVMHGLTVDGFGGQKKQFPLRVYTAYHYEDLDAYNDYVNQQTFVINLYYGPKLNAVGVDTTSQSSRSLFKMVCRDLEVCDLMWSTSRESILRVLEQYPLLLEEGDYEMCLSPSALLGCLQFTEYGEASKVAYLLSVLKSKVSHDTTSGFLVTSDKKYLTHYVPDLFTLEQTLSYLNECIRHGFHESYDEVSSEVTFHIKLSALLGFKDAIDLLYYEILLHYRVHNEGMPSNLLLNLSKEVVNDTAVLNGSLPTDIDYRSSYVKKGKFYTALASEVLYGETCINNVPIHLVSDLRTDSCVVIGKVIRDIALFNKDYKEVCVLLNKLTMCVLYQRKKGEPINLRLPFPIEG